MSGGRRSFDHGSVSEALKVLSHPTRLAVLETLRQPMRTAEAIRRIHAAGFDVSRQAIQRHIDLLVEAGVVEVTDTTVGGRPRRLFQASGDHLFSLGETLRSLGSTFLPTGAAPDGTMTSAETAVTVRVDGPHLVILHGVEEGKVFPLVARKGRGRTWTIGRSDEATHTIAGDMTTSRIHASITQDLMGRFHVAAAEGSKNAALLNWARLDTDPTAMRPGDVLGLGRTKLVFRDGR